MKLWKRLASLAAAAALAVTSAVQVSAEDTWRDVSVSALEVIGEDSIYSEYSAIPDNYTYSTTVDDSNEEWVDFGNPSYRQDIAVCFTATEDSYLDKIYFGTSGTERNSFTGNIYVDPTDELNPKTGNYNAYYWTLDQKDGMSYGTVQSPRLIKAGQKIYVTISNTYKYESLKWGKIAPGSDVKVLANNGLKSGYSDITYLGYAPEIYLTTKSSSTKTGGFQFYSDVIFERKDSVTLKFSYYHEDSSKVADEYRIFRQEYDGGEAALDKTWYVKAIPANEAVDSSISTNYSIYGSVVDDTSDLNTSEKQYYYMIVAMKNGSPIAYTDYYDLTDIVSEDDTSKPSLSEYDSENIDITALDYADFAKKYDNDVYADLCAETVITETYDGYTSKYISYNQVSYETISPSGVIEYNLSSEMAGKNVNIMIRLHCYDYNNDKEIYTGWSPVSSITTHILADPVISSISASGDTVSLSWNKVSGASTYRVYVDDPRTSGFGSAADTTATSITLNMLPGDKNQYYVQALSSNEKVFSVNPVSRAVEQKSNTTFAAPSIKSISVDPDSGDVTLSWTAVAGAEKYHVYSIVAKRTVESRVVSDTECTINPTGKNVSFYVTADNGTIQSNASEFESVNSTSGLAYIKSVVPTSSGNEVTFAIDKTYYDYRLYRSDARNGMMQLIDSGSLKNSEKTVLDDTAEEGRLYFYRVLLYNSNSFAVPSRTNAYEKAEITNVYGSSEGVRLGWVGVDGASKYRIQRKSGTGDWSTIGYTVSNLYIDDTAESGVKYSYRLVPYLGSTWGKASAAVTAEIQDFTVPTGVNAKYNSDKITVTWNNVSSATKYRVQRSVNGGSWSTVGYPTTNQYIDTDIKESTKYTYRVLAYVGGKWSDVSENAAVTVPSKAVAVPPTTVNAKAGDGVVTVSWSKVTGVSKYRVQRSVNGGSWSTVTYPTTESYTDKDVTNGTKYSYRILAYVNGKWSSASKSAEATPTAPAQAVPPTTVSAKAGDGVVTVSWSKVTGVSKYRVQRSVNGGSWSTVTYPTAESYTDNDVTNGTKYSYRILAYVNGKWSSASKAVEATPVSAAQAVPPATVSAKAGEGVVEVSWSKVDGAAKYRVQRSTNGSSWSTINYPATESYTDNDVTNGTKYSYRILAYVNGKWSSASKAVSATPAYVDPPSTIEMKNGTTITLKWSEVPGATKYRVQRSVNDGAWSTVVYTAETTYADSNVENHTKYSYRILAYVNGQWSKPSRAVYDTTSWQL